MNKLLKLNLFLLIFIISFCFGCKEDNVLKLDLESFEVEIGSKNSFSFESSKELDIYIENDEIATFKNENNTVTIDGKSIGGTNLIFKNNDKIIKTINIEIIDKVVYLPVPTGKLLLKGIDKDASVKAIITKASITSEDVIWEVENPEIVSIDYQGCIAKFHSLARGKTLVTVRVGNYSNSFTIYVTNIRGDID